MLDMAGIGVDAGEDQAVGLADLARDGERRVRRASAGAVCADVEFDEHVQRLARRARRPGQRFHVGEVVGRDL